MSYFSLGQGKIIWREVVVRVTRVRALDLKMKHFK